MGQIKPMRIEIRQMRGMAGPGRDYLLVNGVQRLDMKVLYPESRSPDLISADTAVNEAEPHAIDYPRPDDEANNTAEDGRLLEEHERPARYAQRMQWYRETFGFLAGENYVVAVTVRQTPRGEERRAAICHRSEQLEDRLNERVPEGTEQRVETYLWNKALFWELNYNDPDRLSIFHREKLLVSKPALTVSTQDLSETATTPARLEELKPAA